MGLLLSKHQTIMLTCAIFLLLRKIYFSGVRDKEKGISESLQVSKANIPPLPIFPDRVILKQSRY